MDGGRSEPEMRMRASLFLERALLFTIVIHIAAMGSMFLLLPGMPGGLNAELAARASYVGAHPWVWRVGWLPWQLTALSDFLLGAALVCTKWIPKIPAVLALVVTLVSMVPDQYGQFMWTWVGPSIARRAIETSDFAAYGVFEARVFLYIAGWATIGYVAGAVGWTWCFAAAGVWSKRLTVISWVVWPIFAFAAIGVDLKGYVSRPDLLGQAVGLANAIAFVLLLFWLGEVAERVLRRSRPDAAVGRFAVFRHPSRSLVGKCCDPLCNSRLARAFFEFIPALAMDSDITDVIYVNYLVEASRVERFVDEPLKLQRLGPEGKYAFFTFLTFHHGHFGPRCFGPLRRLWPSPIQSNWRIHVYDPSTGKRGIQFLAIAITGSQFAIAARLLAENIPMHVPREAKFSRGADGVYSLAIDPGDGTAPDVRAEFKTAAEPVLTGPWSECFRDWRAVLEYCVPQDRAMSAQPWRNRVTRQEIVLDIPLESCRPMRGSVQSKAARAIAGEEAPLCFLVERLRFRLLGEHRD
jgi:hypothetical protein